MKLVTLENLATFKSEMMKKIPTKILNKDGSNISTFIENGSNSYFRLTSDIGGGNEGTITSVTYNGSTTSSGAVSIPGNPYNIYYSNGTLTINSL